MFDMSFIALHISITDLGRPKDAIPASAQLDVVACVCIKRVTSPSPMQNLWAEIEPLLVLHSSDWKQCITVRLLEGNIQLAEWLVVQNIEWPPGTNTIAALNGDVQIVERTFLDNRGKLICCLAALGGHIDLLQWRDPSASNGTEMCLLLLREKAMSGWLNGCWIRSALVQKMIYELE